MIKDEPREIRSGPVRPIVSVACEMLARLPPVYTPGHSQPPRLRTHRLAGLRASLCCEPTAEGAAVPGGGPGREGGWLSCRALWMAASRTTLWGGARILLPPSRVIYNLKRRVEEHLPKIRQAGNKCQGDG